MTETIINLLRGFSRMLKACPDSSERIAGMMDIFANGLEKDEQKGWQTIVAMMQLNKFLRGDKEKPILEAVPK